MTPYEDAVEVPEKIEELPVAVEESAAHVESAVSPAAEEPALHEAVPEPSVAEHPHVAEPPPPAEQPAAKIPEPAPKTDEPEFERDQTTSSFSIPNRWFRRMIRNRRKFPSCRWSGSRNRLRITPRRQMVLRQTSSCRTSLLKSINWVGTSFRLDSPMLRVPRRARQTKSRPRRKKSLLRQLTADH